MISLMLLPCPSDAPCSMHCDLTNFTFCLDPILQGMSIRRTAGEVDLISAPLNLISSGLIGGRGHCSGEEMPDYWLLSFPFCCL